MATGTLSCGGDTDPGVETSRQALSAASVHCAPSGATPAGYPQRANCIQAKLGPVVCTCFPPNTLTSDNLAFQLVSVMHAPPGNMSSLTYSNGNTVGSIEQITNTTQSGLYNEYTLSVPESTADVEAKFTEGTVSGEQTMAQVINTSTLGIAQTRDVTAGSSDIFYVWLNPQLKGNYSPVSGVLQTSFLASPLMWNTNGQQISSAGPDGTLRMQIEAITGNALANPSARTPAEQGYFGHLTAAQINEILSLDDFYANPSYDPSQHPDQYGFVTTLELAGPEPGATVTPISGQTIEYDNQDDSINGTAKHAELTIKAGPSFGLEGAVTFTAQFGATWTWDYNDTRTDVMGSQKIANLVLQSNTPCLDAQVDLYLDFAFGTWVTVPHFTAFACDEYDPPSSNAGETVCTVGGTEMHCCPPGTGMIGVNVAQNTFKCAPLRNPNGVVSLDTNTERNNMHSCPAGQVMVGLRADLNQLACQTVPGVPITSERVDSWTSDSFPMHVCDSTNLTEAMTGIRIDQNLLNCGSPL